MERVTIGNLLGRTAIELGQGLPTRINLIVGVTNLGSEHDIEIERRKIDIGAAHGVHTITDLSMVRLREPLWLYVKRNYPHMAVGMNPPYLPYVEHGSNIDPKTLFEEIRRFVEGGGDHMTMNLVPRTRAELEEYAKDRQVPITSRQGGLLSVSMRTHRRDNPYWEIINELLPLLRKHRVTVNIGATFRPSGIAEANDRAHRWETQQQLEVLRILDEAGVQALVEAMSHHPLHQIGPGIEALRRQYGSYVPFQFLGPVTTDIGGEADHISSAIGAAEASRYNVGKVTTIPSREHSGFPTVEDTERGIIATKIAVHAGDIARLQHLIDEDAVVLSHRSRYQTCDARATTSGCNKCGEFCPLVLDTSRTR